MTETRKLALVTGGTRGIGAATAIALKAAGYVTAVNFVRDPELAADFSNKHGIRSFLWDVSNFQQSDDGVKKVCDHFGMPVKVLVNNAGITRDGVLHKQSYDNWREVIQTNLDSVFNMSHAVIDGMRKEGFGRIISISSVNWHGMVGQTNYAATKAGIIGFTKSLARESAGKGITVNAIAPGYINTEMVAKVPENILAQIISTIPVQRLGRPEEIAASVVFLAAESSGFITGSVLDINGGMVM